MTNFEREYREYLKQLENNKAESKDNATKEVADKENQNHAILAKTWQTYF